MGDVCTDLASRPPGGVAASVCRWASHTALSSPSSPPHSRSVVEGAGFGPSGSRGRGCCSSSVILVWRSSMVCSSCRMTLMCFSFSLVEGRTRSSCREEKEEIS